MTAPKRGKWMDGQARDSKDGVGKGGESRVWEKARKIHGFKKKSLLGPEKSKFKTMNEGRGLCLFAG
jgi:hypothetical protein